MPGLQGAPEIGDRVVGDQAEDNVVSPPGACEVLLGVVDGVEVNEFGPHLRSRVLINAVSVARGAWWSSGSRR
ncbi:hypothetical protein GCM10010389_09050 [Streptomyces echinoruber]|uniref:Uncharacterized protein n=1 Tax=Streptomyces echinoruber TaxID=68898 RepID=A0A918QV51_9ACTN|nr:hypothetical protein GCM10010389_09050 [Streptomyces echinoruber]